MDYYGFRCWIETNYSYTDRTVSNIVSRLKRANSYVEIKNDPIYLFYLSQNKEFDTCSVSVKSQMRRAINLYFEYIKEMESIDERQKKNN